MPSGTPISIEKKVAATTSTSVCTVCFQSPWLRMKTRPMKTPNARVFDFCNHQASSAISAASSTGGTTISPLTAPSSTALRPLEMPRKNVSKWSVRKLKKSLPQVPIGIFQAARNFETGSITPLSTACCGRLVQVRHPFDGQRAARDGAALASISCSRHPAQLPSAVLIAAAASPPSNVVTPWSHGPTTSGCFFR